MKVSRELYRIHTDSLNLLLRAGIVREFKARDAEGDNVPYIGLSAEARRALLGLPSADRVSEMLKGTRLKHRVVSL